MRKGKTPPLTADDARLLFSGIDTRQLVGLRDRAIIATMFYTFARVSATVSLKVKDYYAVGRDSWIRLHEKGGRGSFGDPSRKYPTHLFGKCDSRAATLTESQ